MTGTNITFFLTLMHSPLIGNKNIINGHAIYNALLYTRKFKPSDIHKVSFGIAHNEPVSYKGFNKYVINIEEEMIGSSDKVMKIRNETKTILDNLKKGYNGYMALRSTQNILTNPLIDYSPINFEIIKTKHGNHFAHMIKYFVFYVVWRNDIPSIDFKNLEISIGASRNAGFGFCRIEKTYSTTVDEIVAGAFDEFTAKNGINGIYNHSKYGFGEFILDKTSKGIKIIKFITPLCMSSTFHKSTQYDILPSFIEPSTFDKSDYYIWDKGTEYRLDCIQPGKVFSILQ